MSTAEHEQPKLPRVRPFSNGSEAMSWKEVNCYQCVRRYDEVASDWRCELEKDIDRGGASDGMIAMETVASIGWASEPYGHLTECRERVR